MAKISYVKGFEPWGWLVGTGIYLDDVDAVFRQDAMTLRAGFALRCSSLVLAASRS